MPTPTQLWMPGVIKDDRGGTGAPYGDGPTVVVLHTTESDGPAGYSGTEPHFEVFDGGPVRQFAALDVCSKALWNEPGGVQTNRRAGHVIQIEIVWRAKNAPNMPDSLLRKVAKVLAFIKTSLPDLALVGAPQGFHGDDEGFSPATVNSRIRFSYEAWNAFCGICAHQHVPENDHWDTGRIDIAKLIRFTREALGASPAPPATKEDQMFSKSPVVARHLIACHSGLMLTATSSKQGSPVVQAASNGALGQRWMVWGHPDTTFSLVSRDGDRALDVPDNIGTPGTLLQVHDFVANDAQKFVVDTIVPDRIGVIRHVSSGLVLDVFQGTNQVGLYTPNGGLNQEWFGAPVI